MWAVFVVYEPRAEGCYLDEELESYVGKKRVSGEFKPEDGESYLEWQVKTKASALNLVGKLLNVRFRGPFRVVVEREPG